MCGFPYKIMRIGQVIHATNTINYNYWHNTRSKAGLITLEGVMIYAVSASDERNMLFSDGVSV